MRKIYTSKLLFIITSFLLFHTLSSYGQTPQYTYGDNSGSNVFPLNTSSSNKEQYFYIMSEFSPTVPPGLIDKIYLRRSSSSSNNSTYTDFTVKIKQEPNNITSFSNTTYLVGMTTVVSEGTFIIPAGSAGDWIEIPLSTPFNYDGTSNLVIEVSQDGYTNGISLRSVTSGTANRRLIGALGNATANTLTTGPKDLGIDLLSIQGPYNDIGVSQINMDTEFCFGTSQDVDLLIENYGNTFIDTFNIGWSINGTVQTPFGFSEDIDTLNGNGPNSILINLQNLNFPQGTSEVKFWTFAPNNDSDMINSNDTSIVNVTSIFYNIQVNDTICEGEQYIFGDTIFTTGVNNYIDTFLTVDGCDSIVNLNLNVTPGPTMPSWNGQELILCEGDNLTLDAYSPLAHSYLWNTGSNSSSITTTMPGNYSVTINDEFNNCELNASVTLISKPKPQVSFPTQTVYCTGESVLLDAGPEGISYNWSTNENTQIIHVQETGNYSVEVINEFGCSTEESIYIEFYPAPNISSIEMNHLAPYKYQFKAIDATNALAYTWNFGDGNTSTLPQPIHTYYGPGVYTIQLTVEGECTENDFYKIIEIENDNTVGIKELNNNSTIIYPNPADKKLFINIKDLKTDSKYQVKILDLNGKEINSLNLNKTNKDNSYEIDISNLPSGMYYLQLISKEKNEQFNFIKK